MTPEAVFHIAFWVLFGGVLAMRLYFSLPAAAGSVVKIECGKLLA